MEKTNVMRLLDVQKIQYKAHEYNPQLTDGLLVAKSLGEDEDRVFKTLVTTDGKKNYFVFVIPVNCTLHLKKAAQSVGAKSIEMIKQKELLPLTGYIHGGCSPIGMKKLFPTIVNDTAELFDTVIFSAGKVGYQVELAPDTLLTLTHGKYADLVE
ncbi:MAG: Cys-tRNA(Pro) deacylase [Clostridia bacterium]|nr:Cys-tRNA(Pro) deacylase [Clostridia bacterium]